MLWLIIAVAIAVVFAEWIVGITLWALLIGLIGCVAIFIFAVAEAWRPGLVVNVLGAIALFWSVAWLFRQPLLAIMAKSRRRRLAVPPGSVEVRRPDSPSGSTEAVP